MLPNFLVIGAMKGGSTALFNYLRGHPEVFMPPVKEANFFSEHNWWRGVEWYERLFDDAADARAVGEASPSYSRYPVSPDAASNLAATLPGARLVYVIREPIDRLVSQYRHLVVTSGETRPIDEAVLDDRVYVSTSRYALQIERYLEFFDRERLLVITSEDLHRRRAETLQRVFRFLEVDDSWRPPNVDDEFNLGDELRGDRSLASRVRGTRLHRVGRRVVPGSLRRRLWRSLASERRRLDDSRLELRPETRRELVGRLRPDLERLRGHLGDDFACWGLLEGSVR